MRSAQRKHPAPSIAVPVSRATRARATSVSGTDRGAAARLPPVPTASTARIGSAGVRAGGGVFPAALGVLLVVFLGGASPGREAVLAGTVRDEVVGRPVAGAVVDLPDEGRGTVTDAAGRYRLEAVSPGPRHLTVRAPGYAERTLHALVPASGTLQIDVELRPDPIPVTGLDVRPPPTVGGLSAAEDEIRFPDRGSSLAAVRNHPLLSEPDVFQALAGGEVVLQPEAPEGLHLRGAPSDQTAWVVDGVPVLSPYHVAGTFSALNPDALARVELLGAAPSPALPDALGGVVAVETRTPGPELDLAGALSTTQARATASGPLGVAGATYLVSLRSGFPGFISPPSEPSYLDVEVADRLVTLRAPVGGGGLRVLAFDSENEVDAAAAASDQAATGTMPRHAFAWGSRSLGGEWVRSGGPLTLRVQAWTARMRASARRGSGPLVDGGPGDEPSLASSRSDRGAALVVEGEGKGGGVTLGIRLQEIRTRYQTGPGPSADGLPTEEVSTPAVALFGEADRRLGRVFRVRAGTALTAAAGDLHAAPRLILAWSPSSRWTLSAAWASLRQFAQSLRNPESVVGTIFPADLWVGAGERTVPVASSRQVILAAEHRPAEGVGVGIQAYRRSSRGLALAAPATEDAFATRRIVPGRGEARGVAVQAAMAGAHYGAVLAWGWQRASLSWRDGSWTPAWASRHSLETGAVVFPSATSSLRLGLTALAGRRVTPVHAALEWESCNLLDRGCEFAGTPLQRTDALGAATLPAYLRVDVGARKHWHLRLTGRDAVVALYGTFTNVLGRANVLTWALDPASGDVAPLEMRPRAPLVVGLDWRF